MIAIRMLSVASIIGRAGSAFAVGCPESSVKSSTDGSPRELSAPSFESKAKSTAMDKASTERAPPKTKNLLRPASAGFSLKPPGCLAALRHPAQTKTTQASARSWQIFASRTSCLVTPRGDAVSVMEVQGEARDDWLLFKSSRNRLPLSVITISCSATRIKASASSLSRACKIIWPVADSTLLQLPDMEATSDALLQGASFSITRRTEEARSSDLRSFETKYRGPVVD